MRGSMTEQRLKLAAIDGLVAGAVLIPTSGRCTDHVVCLIVGRLHRLPVGHLGKFTKKNKSDSTARAVQAEANLQEELSVRIEN